MFRIQTTSHIISTHIELEIMLKMCMKSPGCGYKKKGNSRSCSENDIYHQGCNHVNETARHGIFTNCLWEENLGNITKVFINDSLGIVAQTLWEEFLQAKWAGEILTNKLWKRNRRVHPEGIVKKIPCLVVSFT